MQVLMIKMRAWTPGTSEGSTHARKKQAMLVKVQLNTQEVHDLLKNLNIIQILFDIETKT